MAELMDEKTESELLQVPSLMEGRVTLAMFVEKDRPASGAQQGLRNVTPTEESHVYVVIIVGGGPAAMPAALYAARKKPNSLRARKTQTGG